LSKLADLDNVAASYADFRNSCHHVSNSQQGHIAMATIELGIVPLVTDPHFLYQVKLEGDRSLTSSELWSSRPRNASHRFSTRLIALATT
jgi:hypothetical protein